MRTFDQTGREVPPRDLRGVSDVINSGAQGLWEIFHPGSVKAEYEAVGKQPPTYGEIVSDAASNIGGQVETTTGQLVDSATQLSRLFTTALVAAAVLAAVVYFGGGRQR